MRRSMNRRLIKVARWSPLLGALLLLGCSTIKFAYNNIDWVLLSKADHYLDLSSAQRERAEVARRKHESRSQRTQPYRREVERLARKWVRLRVRLRVRLLARLRIVSGAHITRLRNWSDSRRDPPATVSGHGLV